MISTIDRKRIFIFVAIAYAISIAVGVVIFFNGGLLDSSQVGVKPLAGTLLAWLMFAPTVAHIATRLITREGWSNTFLRPKFRRGWPFYLAAWFLPILATIVGGAIYYLLFPSKFDLTMTWAREGGLIPAGMPSDPGMFLITLIGACLVNTLISIYLMFGEEFGWRAYLLPKLMPLGSRKAVLLVGVIHAAWHWPIIFLGYEYGLNYWGAPVVGPLLFLVMGCYLSVFLGWVTVRSGSVWPAAVGHGAINTSAGLMIYFLNTPPDSLIGPLPVGIVGSLGYAVLALLIFFSPRALAQPTPAPVDMAFSEHRGVVEKAARA